MSYSFPTDATDGDKVQLENGVEYIYQADKDRWMVNSSKDGLAGHFVNRQGGDSMEGPLTILVQEGAGSRDTKRIETYGVFSNSEGSSLRLGTTRDRVYIGHNDTSFNGPVKVDEIQEKNLDGGTTFTNRVILKTEGAEEDEAVTKKYIDDRAEYLQNEIVELEEEIDAIAPSVERGRWSFTAVGTVAEPGQFTMYDADFGNGSPTGLFKSAKSIWFNELDLDGTPHAFADVEEGELLEIFIDGSPEYGLFTVVGEAHDETATGAKFWVIDVDFVRTNEPTTAIGPGEICRFKVFTAPSGGEVTSLVLHTLTTNGNTYRFSNGIDAPTDTSFRTDSINVEYNRQYHFKKLWTASGYDAFLKNYAPTPSTTLEIYLRGALVVKTTVKNWKASSRSSQSIMFDVSGNSASVHNYGSLSNNSYYQVVLTDLVEKSSSRAGDVETEEPTGELIDQVTDESSEVCE